MTTRMLRMTAAVSGELAAAFAAIRTRLAVPDAFPADVLAEANQRAAHPALPAEDLTAMPFITIDPHGSTDLDQAVHLARAPHGYTVHYAIADVPAFVVPGGALDAETRRRGQTLYAPDGRIPLHPQVISEDAASLLPGVVRGAYVWEFNLDEDAREIATRMRRARIRSIRQATYDQVQHEIDAGTAEGTVALLAEIGPKRIALERERGGASLARPSQEITEQDGHYRLVRRGSVPAEEWNAQISLLTGMAAARIMERGGVGIVRTMPAPSEQTVEKFRVKTRALGAAWPESLTYGEYLKTLDPRIPHHLSVIYAAATLFRGAGYTVIDADTHEVPIQAALGVPYAHATAPLRRLVDRYVLAACEALLAGSSVPTWVIEGLPELPALMAASSATASALSSATIAAAEAAVLSGCEGDLFEAIVVSARAGSGTVQLEEPAVTADCDGPLTPGDRVQVILREATIATGTVRFELAHPTHPEHLEENR